MNDNSLHGVLGIGDLGRWVGADRSMTLLERTVRQRVS